MPSHRVTRETLDGQVHYPDKLPHRRGCRSTCMALIVIGLIVAACLGDVEQKTGDPVSFLVILGCAITIQMVFELLWRATYYVEEWRHVKSRHKGSHWHLLNKLLLKNFWATWVYVAACIIFISVIVVQNCDIQDHLWKVSSSLQQVFGILCISDFLKRIVNLSKNPVSDSVFLEKLKLLDYGSGMAQNFFYGYLRIILPSTGDEGKGIIERIDDFISQQRLSEDSFPVKKLFILIPSSSYLPNDLKDCSFDWMKSAGTLEKKIRDRAGVISRPYKNSVYRIKNPDDDNDKGIYVVAEGATPCKTLHEVVQYSGERQGCCCKVNNIYLTAQEIQNEALHSEEGHSMMAEVLETVRKTLHLLNSQVDTDSGQGSLSFQVFDEFYKEHQKEIIFSFFETLRETLREDRDCRGLCEFVYYDDTDEFGLNNVNVGRLLLQRIEEIQATEEFLRGVRDRNI